MEKQIHIEPVTRIEGHAKITVFLDAAGNVRDAQFHVTELRGFEKFCEGRTLWEMPGLTARICGICPVSHILASAKACDAILSVRVPETAILLRRLMNLGQIVQSHALSFFYLSAPDFLLGWDTDPAVRNVVGLIGENPDLARKGIRLRAYGQEIIDRLGGKRIHPAWAVPGGVNQALAAEDRQWMLDNLPEALDTIRETIDLFKTSFDCEARGALGEFRSMYMGLVGPEGKWEHYDGVIRIVDQDGSIVVEGYDPARYFDIIVEASQPWTYLKFPHYEPMGFPGGMYRVGERIGLLLEDARILSLRIRAEAGINELEGVGIHEAPRGTLIHHYHVDENGLIEKANFIVSTGHNNLGMNRAVAEIAKMYIHKGKVTEGILNRIEGGIRAYDPCLSCSVHAVGRMPIEVSIVDAEGRLRETLTKE
jgi:NAD-reducing hydrogenase large subunit